MKNEVDRLRRLDALFAEKVLGCKVRWQADGPWCGCENGKPHQEWGHGDIERLRWDAAPNGGLLLFTRSLDAAWEGMVAGNLHVSELNGGSHGFIEICVRHNGGDSNSGWFDGSKCDHPAEALVLACLRAVGVSEEELK